MALSDLEFYSELPVDKTDRMQDLVDLYNKEAVRRGILYMESLSRADEEYRGSVNEDKMEEGYRNAGVEGSGDDMENVSSQWAEGMKDSGLGLDEDES